MAAEAVEALFKRAHEKECFSGACLVSKAGETVYTGAFGMAHKGFNVPNSVLTRFDTASITKLFTAVAVLQLVDEGQVNLEDSVVDLLGLRGTAISDKVTIYHLLTHSSGIGDDADEEAGERYEDIWKSKPNYSVRETIDFLPQFIHKPPNFEPGQGCRYNNVAYVLLGLVVEKIAKMRYREYVSDNVFRAAGMTRTEFCSLDGVAPDVAEGYAPVIGPNGQIVGWRKNIYSFPPIGSPDGGAYTTVGDLSRFMQALTSGALLSPTLTREMLTPQVRWGKYGCTEKWMGYGFEFAVRENEPGEVLCARKDGVNVGVVCTLRYYPGTDSLIVILGNQECDLEDIARRVEDIVLGFVTA